MLKPDSTSRVGILGGGQLASMLCEALARLGAESWVLAETEDSPALELAQHSVVGNARLREFLSNCSVVLFENEFVDCGILRESARGLPVRFFPDLRVIELLQDKLQQKQLFSKLSIPTSPFVGFTSLDQTRRELGDEIVLKWAKQGYDGKGVHFFKNSQDGIKVAKEFCRMAAERGASIYAEKKALFVRELAVIAVAAKELVSYPVVISEQENGICKKVLGPAQIKPKTQAQIQEVLRKIAQDTAIEGAFGVEFFELENGEIWLNEIAPRVHNTGHYTQDACTTSQFENHARAALGLELGATDCAPSFAMLNLIGRTGLERFSGQEYPLPKTAPSQYLHWYRKTELRAGRKLGHVNAVSSDGSISPEALFDGLLKTEKSWYETLNKRRI